jgi:RNA polymerase sigma-70 factor (sigma-E family)
LSSDTDSQFRAFMTVRWPSLFRTAYLLTGSHHDAEDLAQTALARAYAKWDRVRRSDDMAAYVRRILVNAHADRFRRQLFPWLTPKLPDIPVPDQAAGVERRAALVQALARLPVRQRTVLVLCYVEDMPHAEVAAALNVRESTVRSQITRALAKLRADRTLADLFGPPAPGPAAVLEEGVTR